MTPAATSHSATARWHRRAAGGWGWQWWWPRLLAGGFAAFLVATAIIGSFAGAAFRHRTVTAGDCRDVPVSEIYASRASFDHGIAHLPGGTTVTLWGTGLRRAALICRSAGGTWADESGDASRWLLSDEAPTATIPAALGLLILAWTLNWERLRRLDADPLTDTPNDRAAVIAFLVNRRAAVSARPRTTSPGQPGNRPRWFFATVAVLVTLGALTAHEVPLGLGIRLPAPAAFLILAATGALAWELSRPPRRRP